MTEPYHLILVSLSALGANTNLAGGQAISPGGQAILASSQAIFSGGRAILASGQAIFSGGQLLSGYALLAFTIVLLLLLLVVAWTLLALGVRIGRSMEGHAALKRQLESLAPMAPSTMPSPIAPPSRPVASPLAVTRPGFAAPYVPFVAGSMVAPLPDDGMPLVLPQDFHEELIRDTLTGLWNREAILDLLRREMARATRQGAALGLVMVKLDHFDQLRQEHSDLVLDSLLQRAAEHFVQGLREYDAAGRTGAEFLLVLPGWDPDANPKRVDGMLAPIVMKAGSPEDESSLQLTASIGVASFHPSADSPYPEDLLQRADAAVHAAQTAGRNRAEFAPR